MEKNNPTVPSVRTTFQATQEETHISSYSGPLPDPFTLAEYETVLPGSAEELFKAFELETRHRHEMDNKSWEYRSEALRTSAKERKLGQIFGFIISIISFAIVTACVLLHAETVAAIIGGTTIVGLTASFITGRHVESKDAFTEAALKPEATDSTSPPPPK